jgi:L-seryl-tRNA(Ser) seleniumtransferase
MSDFSLPILRSIPSVSALLDREEVAAWIDATSRAAVTASIQEAIDSVRAAILEGNGVEVSPESILADAEYRLMIRAQSSLMRVINATGIVLHTGLGRAVLSDSALDAIMETSGGYTNLEYDLEHGSRGRRIDHVRRLISRLTGADSATVVNNNAAATLMILQVFGRDREVIVSRGQLVEIGGSFRLPDIFAAGGARLREVGTTNRTRISDYEKAVNDNTAVLMRVHTSNYRVVGFSEEVSICDLVALGRKYNLMTVDDLGSGALIDFSSLGLPPEPAVRDSIESGADLVCFSGDKLVGGPQAGIIAGRRDLIEQIESHPLMRTYRVDKLVLAALDATLRHYELGEAATRIPIIQMLTAAQDELRSRAERLLAMLQALLPEESFKVTEDTGFAGGGSMPDEHLPTWVVRWKSSIPPNEASAALRRGHLPVVARIKDDSVIFDLRTIRPEELEDVAAVVADVLMEGDEIQDEIL